MLCVNQTRPHCVNQMGKTHSKPLVARHGRGTAWARHATCESDTTALCKSNGKTHSKPLAARHGRGTAWARHAMCESSLRRHWNNRKCVAGKLRFPRAEEFLRKLSAFRARAQKMFTGPVLGRKSFKESRFEGALNYEPPRGVSMSRAGSDYNQICVKIGV